MYNAYDHYWDNGTDVFSSKTQTRVPYNNAGYVAWLALGNVPTLDPGETLLREVLLPYQLGLTPEETATFVEDKNDLAALKSAYTTIINDLTTVVNLTAPLTNVQRDAAIQGMAGHFKTLLKGLKRVYRFVT